MKFKPLYIYSFLVLLLIALVFIFTSKKENSSASNIADQEVPNDEIHKGLQNGQNPGKGNVSAEVYKKMNELKQAVEENPNDTLKLKEYADFLTEAHKPDEAIQYYQKILNKDPKRTDILFSLSFVYYNKQEYDKSEELTKRILSLEEKNPLALYNLGAIEATKGNNNKAREVWSQLIKEQPNSEAARAAEQSLSNLKD